MMHLIFVFGFQYSSWEGIFDYTGYCGLISSGIFVFCFYHKLQLPHHFPLMVLLLNLALFACKINGINFNHLILEKYKLFWRYWIEIRDLVGVCIRLITQQVQTQIVTEGVILIHLLDFINQHDFYRRIIWLGIEPPMFGCCRLGGGPNPMNNLNYTIYYPYIWNTGFLLSQNIL